MKLKRLIIQGFKSFKDRTTIHFDDGITGIVGPNGCGKSNIVDALFWVMGEQSAKHLRGSKMKDLIFSGTSKYGPGGFAEASLILENTGGKHIHIGNKVVCPNEIKITRKLYRNGETEYRLNDSPCRLKDVQEVFMDTGAGAKSYSIIAQGEINKLVQAKPVERRTMIEEVAGITKFKIRRKESLRKMENTKQNLERLKDLTQEVERQLKQLQSQAEKAQKAKRLKERIEKYDLVVSSHEEFEHLKGLQENLQFLDEKKIELESNIALRDQLELDLEDERISRDEKVEVLDELQADLNKLSNELSAAEERLNNLYQSLTDKETQMELRQKERTQVEEDLKDRQLRLEESNKKLSEIEEEEYSEEVLEELKERLEISEGSLEENRDAREDLESSFSELSERKENLEKSHFEKNSRIQLVSGQIEEISQDIETIETQYSGFHQEVSTQRASLKTLEEEVELMGQEVQELKSKKAEADVDFKERKNLHREVSKSLTQKEATLDAHKSVLEQMSGSEGAQKVMEGLGGELSLLEKFIKCEDKYIPVVNRAIAPFKDMVVGDIAVDQLKEFLNNSFDDKVDLLIPRMGNKSVNQELGPDMELTQRLKLLFGESAKVLSEVVECVGPVAEELKSLFSVFVVAENLDLSFVKTLPVDLPIKGIYSIAGDSQIECIANQWVYHYFGSSDKSLSRLERINLVDNLQVQIDELTQEESSLQEQVMKYETQISEMNLLIESKQDEYSEKKGKLTELRGTNSALEKNYSIHQSKIEKLIQKRSQLSEEKFRLTEEIENISTEKDEIVESYDALKMSLEEKQEEFKDLAMVVEEQRKDFLEKQLQLKSYQERKDSIASQCEDSAGQVQKSQERLTLVDQHIADFEEEILSTNESIENLEAKNKSDADALSQKQGIVKEHKEVLDQMLSVMNEREEKVKQLTKDINAVEKSLVEKDLKVNQVREEESLLIRDVFEKYHIDLREVLKEELELNTIFLEKLEDVSDVFVTDEEVPKEIMKVSYEFSRRYGQDLKDCKVKYRTSKSELTRLGSINWQAVEEFDRQKKRSDFLKAQEMELTNSLMDLEKAIEHIDVKSRERFKIAFEEVNVRFEKVFPIIFGGGSARLRVMGHLDDPECGVDIIAQPPGKKMQNINLMSGGEKALTAVSLIFSIFLVKPSPFCLLDEVDAPLDDANVGRFNELLREMSSESQFILITHNKKTMELNDSLYGVTMQEPGVSKAVSVQLQ